ncbi:hypothetical protein [Tahibacter amnicola]|uniref:Lipoprotein n=1 Tax=Tahibacter amnicola TaxID=2976241 RepID=A0ABY6BI41_9GAMM|nr:hypothetical protein [Tahibacter amnicola]UXI69013.1 hypothetical protein N4264_04990 [Tahibacter amnicola]
MRVPLFRVFSLTALAATGCAAASLPTTRAETTYGHMPATVCIDHDARQRQALADGLARLVLHIQHGEPARRYSPLFTVNLIHSRTGQRIPVDHFSLHADPTGTTAPPPQRVGINLSGHLPADGNTDRTCFEIAADLSDAQGREWNERKLIITASIGGSD